jgi:hypothetical protein
MTHLILILLIFLKFGTDGGPCGDEPAYHGNAASLLETYIVCAAFSYFVLGTLFRESGLIFMETMGVLLLVFWFLTGGLAHDI